MSAFFWNIRGFNKKNKQKIVRDWIRSHSFQFGCLLKTKVKENRASEVMRSAFNDWNMVSNYEFHHLGRIWVVWNSTTTLQVTQKSDQKVTALIKMQNSEQQFHCSFIYAANSAEERKKLWKDIKD